MAPRKFGSGHEDLTQEREALRALRGEAEATARAEESVVRATNQATEAERAANQERVNTRRLQKENADAAERQRAAGRVTVDPGIQLDTDAIRANTAARNANAESMARQAAAARRLTEAQRTALGQVAGQTAVYGGAGGYVGAHPRTTASLAARGLIEPSSGGFRATTSGLELSGTSNAAILGRLEQDIRTEIAENRRMWRESMAARGALAGTLGVAAAGSRYVVQESTTGERVHGGSFATIEAANRRLAALIEQTIAAQRQITEAALQQAVTERAIVVAANRELAIREVRSREVATAEVLSGVNVGQRQLGPGGPGPNRLLGAGGPYGNIIRHPNLFGQRDYGPRYGPYAGRGAMFEFGAVGGYAGQHPAVEELLRSYGYYATPGAPFGPGPRAGVNPRTGPQLLLPQFSRSTLEGVRHEQAFGTGARQPGTPDSDYVRRVRLTEETERATRGLEDAYTGAGRASRQAAAEFATADQSMYRHGALTSEFILSALQGQVTMRDLGTQVAITTAKFAGWTLAAASVYAAVRAIGALGKGAIESNRAVAELGRYIGGLNTSKAQQELRNLSREMNLPLDVVAQQVEAAARLTGDTQRRQGPDAALNMATNIAHTTLLLSRVGDLDPAVAQKYTAALQTGFHMSAQELSLFVDQLNELQNRMNIPLDVSAQAAATAAGTWRSAGGTPNVLASLIAAGRRGTGFSGQILGTTFSRSATMIGRASNRSALQAFGIDPDQTVDEIYQQAIAQVRSGRVRGRRVIQLGEALSTPQLAGRGVVAALRNYRGFDEAQRLQGAEAGRGGGSAMRELHQVLKAVDEQIRRIGVNLVNLGSAIGQSNVLAPLGVMLDILNKALRVTTFLVEEFDKIPSVLRTPLILLGEMSAMIAVMRRAGAFRAGGAMTGAFPALGVLDSPVGRTNAGVMRGLTAQRDYARTEREAATRRYATARFASEARVGNELEFQRAFDEASAAGTLPPSGTAAREDMEEKRRIARERIQAEQANLDRMWDEEVIAARKYAIRTEEELAAFRKMGPEERARFAASQGYYTAGTKHPDPHGAAAVDPLRDTPLGQRVPITPEAERVTQGTTGRIRGWNQRLQGWSDKMREQSGEVNRFTGRSGQAAQRALAAGASATGRAATFTGGLASGTRRFTGALRNFALSLGALDWAFIGVAVIAELNHIADQSFEAAENTRRTLERENVSPQQELEQRRVGQRAIQRQREETTFQPGNARAMARGYLHNAGNVFARIGDTVTGRVLDEGYQSPEERDRVNAQIAEQDQKLAEMMTRMQARQRRRHKPIPFRWYDDITRNVDQLINDRAAFEIGQGEFDKRLDKLRIEVETGRGTRPQRQRALMALAQAGAITGDVTAARSYVNQLDAKNLQPFMAVQAGQLSQYGFNSDQGRRASLLLRESYGRAVRRWGGSTDPARMQEMQNARQAFFQAIAQTTDADLQAGLASAGSESERRAAFAQADVSARQAVDYANRMLAADQARLAHAKAIGDKAGVSRFARAVARDNDEVAAAARDYEQGQKARTEAALQDRQQGREIYSATRQSGTADPLAQAREAERTAQRNLRDARAHGTNRDVQQGIKAVRDARTQRVKAELESLRSEGELQTARGAQDPVSQAKAAARQAQQAYAFMQAHRRQFSPTERRDALRAVIEANRAVDQAIIQQANDANDLAGQIAQAQHEGDPLAQANDALRTAQNVTLDPNDPNSAARKRLGIIQAHNQQKQSRDDLVRARGEYQAALVGDDPRAAAQAAVRNDHIAIGQAVRGTADWYRARAQLVQDQRAVRDANNDYQQARYEYLESLTTDPVKQAVLQERAARQAVRGTTGAARLRARAEANRARQNTIATRIQGREDTIDFNLTMERITRDEAISQLESLSKTRGITKQTRRSILERIKSLKDESEQEAQGFNLDVGNIKMPTIYDVRRALAPARQMVSDARASMRMHVNVGDITITDPAAADRFWQGMDRTLNTTVRAGARAALPR